MTSAVLGWALVAVCVVMALMAAGVYRLAGLGAWWVVPSASLRAAAQLSVVAVVLAAAMARLWTSVVVLIVMFAVATATAARRSQAARGSYWLTLSLTVGLASTLPLMLATGLVPLEGPAVVPVAGILLGGNMTAVAVAARRALDALDTRHDEVEAALSLGFADRDARMLVIHESAPDALLPNVDQARTAGLVTLPGAFVGVLVSTGSAVQAGAVQILVLVGLLLSQSCGVALTIELAAAGLISRRGHQ